MLKDGVKASEDAAQANGASTSEAASAPAPQSESTQPSQSISQMLMALDNGSNDSSQSGVGAVLSEQRAVANEKSKDSDDIKENGDVDDIAESTTSDDSFKENKPVQRKVVVVNPVEMSPMKTTKVLSEATKSPEAKSSIPEDAVEMDAEENEDASDDDSSDGVLTPSKNPEGANAGAGFFKRKPKSPFKRGGATAEGDADESGQEKKYRIMCQCGARNCRKYLY